MATVLTSRNGEDDVSNIIESLSSRCVIASQPMRTRWKRAVIFLRGNAVNAYPAEFVPANNESIKIVNLCDEREKKKMLIVQSLFNRSQ